MVVPISRDMGQYLTAEQARRIDEAAARESHEAVINPVLGASSRVARRQTHISYSRPTSSLVDDACEIVGNVSDIGFGLLHNFYKIVGLE